MDVIFVLNLFNSENRLTGECVERAFENFPVDMMPHSGDHMSFKIGNNVYSEFPVMRRTLEFNVDIPSESHWVVEMKTRAPAHLRVLRENGWT